MTSTAAKRYYRDSAGLRHDRGSRLAGPALRLPAHQHRAPLAGAVPDRAARRSSALSEHTTCLAFGLQLANYRQLRDAGRFLREQGVPLRSSCPPELHPGIDYAAHVLRPGRPLHPALLLHGADWLGRPPAAGNAAPSSDARRMAGDARAGRGRLRGRSLHGSLAVAFARSGPSRVRRPTGPSSRRG